MLKNQSRSTSAKREHRKFRLLSLSENGIRSPPVSGPRPSSLVRSLAGRVRRPSLGLLSHAHSRGYTPSPSTVTLNCARSVESCGDGETSERIFRDTNVLYFSLLEIGFVLLLLLLGSYARSYLVFSKIN